MSNSKLFGEVKKAVFLDRDGTINLEKEYLYKPEEFEFTPGAAEGIRMLNQAGYLVVVVTNQSGVARGYYDEEDVRRLHGHIDNLLQLEGAWIDAWYFCPHHTAGREPYNQQCTCRKPLPGMLHKAAEDFRIDLSRSWMVGDKIADVEAGMSAGCSTILVLTGYGEIDRVKLPATQRCCQDLLSAVRLITAV